MAAAGCRYARCTTSAHPNPQTHTLAPKPTPKATPISDQVRTLHNYTDVVSGYVAPTVDHRSGAACLFFNSP